MSNVDSELQALRLTSEVYSSPRLKPDVSGTANTTNISNMNASNQEDENLIRTRRDIIIPINSPTTDPKFMLDSMSHATANKPSKNLKKRLSEIMSSKLVEINVIILIVIYMLVVLVNILLDDGNFDSDNVAENAKIDDVLNKLKYLELAILSLFTIEVLLKVWAFGLRGYFKDCWYILDAIIIVATFALVILDIVLDESKLSGLSKIRVLFRLFRIVMLMRKANQFSRITKSRIRTAGIDLKSPVEKILELLESLKLSIKDQALAKEIDWAIDIISNNKLYEPLIEPSEGKPEEKSDASLWLKAYSKAAPKSQENQEAKLNVMDYSQRMSILTPGAAKKDSSNLLATPISQEAINMLDKQADSITFDVFAFKSLVKENELVYMACYLFQKRNLFQYLNISQFTFTKFIKKIQSGYLPNLYHNSIHATDVLQTTNYFLGTGDFAVAADLSNLEIAAMYISAAIHDYEHPGTNNTFQINIGSMTAIRYNDKSVLENHHVSAAFALLKDDSLNIFNNFSKADFKVVRERIISMVLGTDMASHFSDVAKLKGRLAADFDIKTKDKNFCMDLLVHAADISNPTKCWKTSCEWTTRVMQEFFDQGDQERNLELPITHLCDKYTVNMAKSQTGFIDFIVAPFFGLLKEILPKIEVSNIEINKNIWKEQIDKYEQELVAKLNEKKDTRKMLS